MAMFLAMLFITILGNTTFSVMGIEVETYLNVSPLGITEIRIPPVGSITAVTHLTPMKISIVLQSINIDVLRQLIKEAPSSLFLSAEIKNTLLKNIKLIIMRIMFGAALGGALGAILVCGKKVREALSGALAGILICILLLTATYSSYEIDKLRTPEYYGALKAAPWAIDMAEKAFHRFNVLGEQMQIIAANLYQIFEQIDKIKPLAEDLDDLLVLHVSDIHNNPVSHEFINQIVKSFPIDMVIDTGDITDYGTPIESNLLAGLIDLQIPYLFIPGNHDSPEIIAKLSEYPQVLVLTGGIVDVQGLRILALADPSSASFEITPAAGDAVIKAASELASMWQEAEKKPYLLAVHNLKVAEHMIGRVPVLLYGHTHQFSIKEENGSILVNPGTSGGAGIRGLQATKEIPYSVVLLHFKKNEENELILTATDTIKLFNLEKGFTLERKQFSG